MSTQLELTLFGSPEIRLHGRPVSGFRSSKVQALLFYLAVTGRPHTRSALATLLWGDQAEEGARINLRTSLSNLHDLVGDALVIDRQRIAFNRAYPYSLDSEKLSAALAQPPTPATLPRLQAALALYRGDFLEGFYVRDAPDFEQWQLMERAAYRQAAIHGLLTLAQTLEQQGDLPAAMIHTRRLLALEPWQEEAQRRLMILLARTGQRAAALAQFERCRQVLMDELGVEPDAETLATVGAIRRGAFDQPLKPSENAQKVAAPAAPLATPHPAPHPAPLPSPPTELIGRSPEVNLLCDRLLGHGGRLLTLIGPPGIGKTRLAQAVAAKLQGHYRGGVIFVPLAPVEDPDLVAATIAAAIGLHATGQRTPAAQLIDFLRRKEALLLLDNFEQITPASALVADLLANCPRLCILVTSRERLHVRAEQRYRVPPLATEAAVTLFVQRAQAVKEDFVLTAENEATLVEICRLLDGLPLAIELSAARSDLYSPQALLARLRDQRLDLLSDGPLDLPPHQRTLRNAIHRSYGLLDALEQRLFRTLGVFAGGFTAQAATALGGSEAHLQALMHKSLVQAAPASAEGEAEPRFLLLETLRAYAWEQLCAYGEEAATQRRHAAFYLQLAEEAATHFRSSDQALWLNRLEAEVANLRAALVASLAGGQIEIAQRLGIALWRFWDIRGYYVEGMEWLARLAALPGATTHQAQLFYGRGMLARRAGKLTVAQEALNISLVLYRHLEEPRGIASALRGLGFVAYFRGERAAARLYLDEALTLFRQLDDLDGIAVTLENLGYICEDPQEEHLLYEESLRLRRRSGNLRGITLSLNALTVNAIANGDLSAARRYLQEKDQVNEAVGNQSIIASSLSQRGKIAFAEGDYAAALAFYEQSLKVCRQSGESMLLPSILRHMGLLKILMRAAEGDDWASVEREVGAFLREAILLAEEQGSTKELGKTLNTYAFWAQASRKLQRALTLAAAAARYYPSPLEDLPAYMQTFLSGRQAAARAELGEAAATAAIAAGERMTQEEAVAFAIEEVRQSDPI
jgi:predicted ATPase/DNA-binding SARP family transcriptional activator